MKSFPRMLTIAQQAMKSFLRMLIAQPAHAKIFVKYPKKA
jgi:hypothetical protein